MAFPRRLLTDDEEIVVELHPHWAFLGWPLVVAAAAVVFAIAVVAVFPHAPVEILYVLLLMVGGSALWLSGRLIRWFASSLVVTTQRIVRRSGVVARSGLELRLERVNQLSYRQSLVGRLFRSGELLVEMGGETGVVVFDHVSRPAAVQSVITEQINAVHHRPAVVHRVGPGPVDEMSGRVQNAATPPSGTPRVAGNRSGEGWVAARLVELDDLRRRGILTDAEFAAKKAELLARL